MELGIAGAGVVGKVGVASVAGVVGVADVVGVVRRYQSVVRATYLVRGSVCGKAGVATRPRRRRHRMGLGVRTRR